MNCLLILLFMINVASDELSRVKKELIDACAQHTHALSIIDAKDQAIRNKEADIDELNKQLKVSA
jgi:hypothetical protein